jgi:hypothetical protein
MGLSGLPVCDWVGPIHLLDPEVPEVNMYPCGDGGWKRQGLEWSIINTLGHCHGHFWCYSCHGWIRTPTGNLSLFGCCVTQAKR